MTDNGEFYGVHYYEELTDACDKVDADIHAYMEKTGKNDDLKPIVCTGYRLAVHSSI